MRKMVYSAVALLICAAPAALRAQGDALSDQEALVLVLQALARETAAACPAGPVLLRITPDGASVVLRQVFAEALMDRGLAVQTTGDGEQCRMEVDARGMYSSTVSAGNSSYLRKTVATLGILIEERSGKTAYARERTLERSDTLQGEAPFEFHSYLDDATSWWDGLLEPLLVTVTAVVIVVLLFTVRGSS
ncbi:MAG: hypothetical protein IH600_03600 [Bacteroidetes bacterium]|nr:hypothetical protein [Bacteroidota bacterium]